jgi:hypothetical protein
MGCKKKQYNYLGVIWIEKWGNDIMKDLKNIGAKLMCVFPQLFPCWKQIVAKWFNKYNTKCCNPTLAKCGGEAQHLEKLEVWSPPGLPNG